MLDGLGEAGGEIGLEAARAMARARGGPGRQAAAEQRLQLGRRLAESRAVHRALGRCQQAQDAAALGRAAGQPGRDEVGQRSRERRALELAPRGDQLLDDERRARRAFRDQHHDRRRRPLAVDPLDQAGDLAPGERRQVDPDRRPEAGLDDRQVLPQRVLPGQPVRLVRQHERDPLVSRDAGEERGERPGRGVGRVEVLEDEHDRTFRGDAAQPAQERLQGPRLPPLGIGEVARGRPRHLLGALGHAGQAQQDRTGIAGEERLDLGGRSLGEQRTEGVEHGRPWRIDRSVGLPSEHERWSRETGDPVERLVDEARHAHPGAAGHDHGRGRTGRGGGDRVGNPRELRLPADEPSTDHASRHRAL